MKKKIILVLLIVVEASILFCCGASDDKKTKAIEVQQKNDLPNLVINFSNGTQVHARELEGNTVIILFFPDCDHCQREATNIQKNLDRFKNYTLYFLATTPLPEIEAFAAEYKLNNIKNVRFGVIAPQDVLSNFGSIPTPSLYIYSNTHRLVQTFNGETDIETVLKYIQ